MYAEIVHNDRLQKCREAAWRGPISRARGERVLSRCACAVCEEVVFVQKSASSRGERQARTGASHAVPPICSSASTREVA